MTEVFTAGEFTNLKGSIRLNQINSFDLQLINLSDAQLLTVGYNKPVEIIINGRQLLIGTVTRFEKRENIPIWDVHVEGNASILRDLSISNEQTYNGVTVLEVIEDIVPADWVIATDYTTTDKLTDYKLTPVRALSAISDLCQIGGLDWYVDKDNSGNNRLNLINNLQPSTVTNTYHVNEDCVNVDRKKNTDVLVTSVVCSGVQPELSRTFSVTSAVTPTAGWGWWGVNETRLTTNCTEGDTSINVYTTQGFPSTGVLQVATETIKYSGKTTSSFTGLENAYNNTRRPDCPPGYTDPATYGGLGVFHKAYSDVMIKDTDVPLAEYYPTVSPAIPTSGTIRVGMEDMTYSFLYQNTLKINARGANGSTPYSHGRYTPVQFLDWATTSPILENGTRQKTVTCTGAVIVDTLDKVAANIVRKYSNTNEYGSFTSLETDFWKEVPLGSELIITPVTGPALVTRLIGVDYDQFKPMVIYFGVAEDYVAADIGGIQAVKEVASEKAEYTSQATILQVQNSWDSSTKMVKVTAPDGTEKWVEVV